MYSSKPCEICGERADILEFDGVPLCYHCFPAAEPYISTETIEKVIGDLENAIENKYKNFN